MSGSLEARRPHWPHRPTGPGRPTLTTLQQQARALGDPTRFAIFRYIADADAPVGVAELTAYLALNHNAIRQHLAKLVTAGLALEATGASAGPGRPRLLYELSAVGEPWEVGVDPEV